MEDNKMEKGVDSLREAVIGSCKDAECFNEDGCNITPSKCFHKYCDKFKWIIERAKHYSEKTKVPYLEILKVWEKERTYSYMNYYQDANFPLLDDNVKIFETKEEARKAIGKKFRCSSCGGISTSPYQCNSGVIKTDIKDGKRRKCNWKVYGLFGTLGKGQNIFVKEGLVNQHIFMPITWEETDDNRKKKTV